MICTYRDYVFMEKKFAISKLWKGILMKIKMNGMKVFVRYTNCLLKKKLIGYLYKKSLSGWLVIIGLILIGKQVKDHSITENHSGFTSSYYACFINDGSTCSQRFSALCRWGFWHRSRIEIQMLNLLQMFYSSSSAPLAQNRC